VATRRRDESLWPGRPRVLGNARISRKSESVFDRNDNRPIPYAVSRGRHLHYDYSTNAQAISRPCLGAECQLACGTAPSVHLKNVQNGAGSDRRTKFPNTVSGNMRDVKTTWFFYSQSTSQIIREVLFPFPKRFPGYVLSSERSIHATARSYTYNLFLKPAWPNGSPVINKRRVFGRVHYT